MFSGSKIEELVKLLQTRGVNLYHACQYQDFVSYLSLGGVSSRGLLQCAALAATPFTTDQIDQVNGVWDKVFVNIDDFGWNFARGDASTPNPYGPLLIRLHPSALLEAYDVAICLRSAGARGFRRERESLKSVADVNRLFWKPLDEQDGLARLKFKSALRQEFGPAANAVEVSCTCKNSLLTFARVFDVLVDPYVILGDPLAQRTRRAMAGSGQEVPVKTRNTKIGSKIYNQLASLVRHRTPALTEFPGLTEHACLLEWAERIRTRGLEYNYIRFADYLRTGTLKPIAALALQTDKAECEQSPDHLYVYDSEGEDEPEDFYDSSGEEMGLLAQEREDNAEDWARSDNEGWYYADEDPSGG